MSWLGWFTYADTEIINSYRTERLARSAGWFRPTVDVPFRGEYDPISDFADPEDTPWFDSEVPASSRFYGAYPLTVTGINDSTRGSTPIESTGDGGVPGRIRFGIKNAVFSVALLGADEEAVQYGLAWLSRALLGSPCGDTTRQRSLGFNLDYYDAEPVVNVDSNLGVQGVHDNLFRRLRRVTFNQGPTVTASRTLTGCDGAFITATFTATVGDPFEYGTTRGIFTEMPIPTNYSPDVSPPGSVAGPSTYVEAICGEDLYQPLFDPNCPVLIAPTTPPNVPLTCYTQPASWRRYQATIPMQMTRLWIAQVPTVTITNPSGLAIRGIRVRIYEDPDGDGNIAENPCDYVADWLATYIPASGSIVIDGVAEKVMAVTSNGTVRGGDSLVIGTDQKPFQWPLLDCKMQYILTLDIDITPAVDPTPVVDLDLTPRII